MNINEQKRYVFKKPYSNEYGTIPEGTEVNLFRGFIYINGGMCDSYSKGLLSHILADEKLRNEYLQPMKIINNQV